MARQQPSAAVGFTVKSGWACAVFLAGPAAHPHVLDSRRVELSDPSNPDARQPYHDGFGTARANGPELTRLLDGVKRFGRQSVLDVIREYTDTGRHLSGAGIVVGSLIDPERLGNSHIRIHALEGQLFREVVADAAARSSLKYAVWRERDLLSIAVKTLERPERDVRQVLAAVGRTVGGSWRAEHKAATLAAWLLLDYHRHPSGGQFISWIE